MAKSADAKDFNKGDSMKVFGPYINNCNRLFVVIVNNGKKTTISYPRYLMEKKLGRPLEPQEDVHHIDGNPLNNELSNLEVRYHGEHQKEHSLKMPLQIEYKCDWCGKKFILSKHQRDTLMHPRKDRPLTNRHFCSRKCAGKCGRQEQLSRDTKIE